MDTVKSYKTMYWAKVHECKALQDKILELEELLNLVHTEPSTGTKKKSSKKLVSGGCRGFRTIKGDDGFFTRIVPCCGKDLFDGFCKRHNKEKQNNEEGHLSLGEQDHPYPQTRYKGAKLKTLVNHLLYGDENQKNLNYQVIDSSLELEPDNESIEEIPTTMSWRQSAKPNLQKTDSSLFIISMNRPRRTIQ